MLPPDQLQYMVGYGPHVNCTLDLCPLAMSITGYFPSLPINIIFIVLYALALVIHVFLGFRWRSWWFTISCVTCCISAIVGYVARIVMHYDIFAFYPFLIQAVFLTIVPVFYCAGIYVILGMLITNLAPELQRSFNPRLFVWIFLPGDLAALSLQVAGAVISSTADVGSEMVHTGEKVSVAGLALQVGTIFVFCLFFLDFTYRYFKHSPRGKAKESFYDARLRFFIAFIFISLLLTTARSAYRVAELNQGYAGALMKEEALFVMMEGCCIIVSVFLLTIGHPGFVFREDHSNFVMVSEERLSVGKVESSDVITQQDKDTETAGKLADIEKRLAQIELSMLSGVILRQSPNWMI